MRKMTNDQCPMTNEAQTRAADFGQQAGCAMQGATALVFIR
jgi:hypothetical protein